MVGTSISLWLSYLLALTYLLALAVSSNVAVCVLFVLSSVVRSIGIWCLPDS